MDRLDACPDMLLHRREQGWPPATSGQVSATSSDSQRRRREMLRCAQHDATLRPAPRHFPLAVTREPAGSGRFKTSSNKSKMRRLESRREYSLRKPWSSTGMVASDQP